MSKETTPAIPAIKILDTAHEYLDNDLELNKSSELDQLANYKIALTKPLEHLDGAFAKAYACSNNMQVYCLVFDCADMPRINLIAYLKSHAFEHLISPLDYGIATISLDHQEHFIVIMPLLSLMTLKEFIINKGPCSQEFAVDHVLIPITNILQKFEMAQVAHGKINLSNIFIGQDQQIFLGECITDLPLYKQNDLYCALEIFDALPIARGFNYIAADYYALGVVYLLIIAGHEKKLESVLEQIMQARIALGSSNIMLDSIKISHNNKMLLRGLLSDRVNLRWRAKEILAWYDGNNSSNGNELWQAEKPMMFLEKECYNVRHLAYELQKNWDLAQKFIIENKISLWMERVLGNKELAETLEVASRNALKSNGSKTLMDDALIKFIAALDEYGPLRFKDASMMIESVCVMLFYGFFLNKNNYIVNAGKIIKGGLWRIFEKKFFDKKNSTHHKFINLLEQAHRNYGLDILGFGPERCLYDLNPNAPCQSLLVKGKIITSIRELLYTLNQKLANATTPIIDRHISAFILSKLNISYETLIGNILSNNTLNRNRELLMVIIFDQAQKSLIEPEDLKELIKACVINLSNVLKSIHNIHTKEVVMGKLNSLVKDNSLAPILAIVLNEKIHSNDLEDFNIAKEKYKSIMHLRAKLLEKARASEIGYRYGLKLCVIFSYIFCFLMFLFLLSKHVS